jgi:putative tryptophan/tyrosine transport system substrate-binding protein
MLRRTFSLGIASGTLGTTIARAQQGKTAPRVGILDPSPAADPFNAELRTVFAQGGMVEGQTVTFDWFYADGDMARLPALAAAMARLPLSAVMSFGEPAIRAARQAAPALPIVAASDDLVGEGFANSLGRSNGNFTGFSILASELNAKRLEFLKAAVPAARRIGVLWDPNTGTFHLEALRHMAANLQVDLKIEEVRAAGDVARAFAAFAEWQPDGLNVLASPLVHALRQPIIERAVRARLPAIFQWGETADQGGLMAYGPFHREAFRAMARQLDRALKGTPAGDIPVEQPTEFELVINMKTARATGLAIPPTLLARADRIVE